ncbi:hypothetical protein L218DRAFT_872273, partial [Marasmius fiardii PR-910]
QQAIYDEVVASAINNVGELFFIQSPGGCGKAYLCNTIAAKVQSERHVVLMVASSGIAALLLSNGSTSHS